uniref:Uncharacterized protein n=1 Tax=Tanacetum cinerariifolium TaxID=118510 RepID=A0A6L2JKL2_TANCI|nr:hypothetical protein [Tanacetum cinerariifolium]
MTRSSTSKLVTLFVDPKRHLRSRRKFTPSLIHNIYPFSYESKASETEYEEMCEVDIDTLTMKLPSSFILTSRTLHTDLLNSVSSFGAIRRTEVIPTQLSSWYHMAEETSFIAPVEILEEGPSEPDPKEPPVGINIFHTTNENHTSDHTPENTSDNASGDPVMHFVVHNFEQINAMYVAFSSRRKEVHPT